MNVIPILFAGNSKMFDGAVIAALSIVKYCKVPLQVYLLTMGLSERDESYTPLNERQRAFLEKIYKQGNAESEVRLIDVRTLYLDSALDQRNEETGYTPYAFLRLYADRLNFLPDKVIYLDTDTVLCGDISKLYEVDLEEAEFAAVRDRYGKIFLGINYINTGVLLLNLKKIRERRTFQRALELCAKRKLFLPDQTALNRAARKKKFLPRAFNEQKKENKNTLIRHFSMTIKWFPFRTQNIKPWHIERIHGTLKCHTFDDILEEYIRCMSSFDSEK